MTLLGGTSSDSGSEDGDFTKAGMKAVVTLNRLHKRIRERPSRVIAEFEKQSWGKYKGLFRCAVMDAAAYELLRGGESQAAAAQLAQNMKAKLQAVLQGGDWNAAWLLTGLADPLQRREFAGTKEEMAVVSGYLEALSKLKKKVRESNQGSQEDDLDAEEGGGRPPKK